MGNTKTLTFLPYHLASMANHAGQGIVSLNTKLKVSGWNPAAENMFGIPATEALGRNVFDIISATSQVSVDMQLIDAVLKSKYKEQGKTLRRNGSGNWFPSRIKAYANTDENGVATGVTLIFTDLTTSEYLSDIISEMGELGRIVGWEYHPQDQSFKITEGAGRILSTDTSGWGTLSGFTHYFDEDSQQTFLDSLDEALKSGSSARLKLQNQKKDRHLRISYRTESANRKVVRIYGILQDISNEVANQQLIADQENQIISRSRLAAVGELAAGVAHEVNNPLAIISGFLEVMTAKADGPGLTSKDIEKIMPKIKNGLTRISTIVAGLLKFSRSGDTGEYNRINIHDVIEETIKFIELDFNHSNIKIERKLEAEDPYIVGSTVEVGQVVLNIVKNARDFFLENQVLEREIVVETKRQSDGWLNICIENSGPKIAEDVADKIFEPFYTTKEVGKGTGLGMSVSHNIIKQHSGNIYIDMNRRRTSIIIDFPPPETKSNVA